ncbi:MAG: 2Fe-2S iron-sulfur cluster-binding protein [Chromatiales bacterium]|nr:2Fe-2S iron-sulfur cluster-binding protein [Chromatiales bacterium]
MISLIINGQARSLDVSPDTPLLWVLRDTLGLTGTKYGCGVGAVRRLHRARRRRAGALLHRRRRRRWPARPITTIEGLVDRRRATRVQRAWVALDVPQCGYCQSGQIMAAAALLAQEPEPERRRHRRARMAGNLCRCGTYPRIRAAIKHAAAAKRRRAHMSIGPPTSHEPPRLPQGRRRCRRRPGDRLRVPPARPLALSPRPPPPAARARTPACASAPTTRVTVLSPAPRWARACCTAHADAGRRGARAPTGRASSVEHGAGRPGLRQPRVGHAGHRRQPTAMRALWTPLRTAGARRARAARRSAAAQRLEGGAGRLPRRERRGRARGQRAAARATASWRPRPRELPVPATVDAQGPARLSGSSASRPRAPRHAGQGQRQRRVRHRRAAAAACSRPWSRAARCSAARLTSVRRRRGAWPCRACAQVVAGRRRRGGGGRQLLGRAAGRATRSRVEWDEGAAPRSTAPPSRAELRRAGAASPATVRASEGDADAGARGRSARRSRPCTRCPTSRTHRWSR